MVDVEAIVMLRSVNNCSLFCSSSCAAIVSTIFGQLNLVESSYGAEAPRGYKSGTVLLPVLRTVEEIKPS